MFKTTYLSHHYIYKKKILICFLFKQLSWTPHSRTLNVWICSAWTTINDLKLYTGIYTLPFSLLGFSPGPPVLLGLVFVSEFDGTV